MNIVNPHYKKTGMAKIAYPNYSIAQEAIHEHKLKYDMDMMSYECSVCDMFHLARQKKE